MLLAIGPLGCGDDGATDGSGSGDETSGTSVAPTDDGPGVSTGSSGADETADTIGSSGVVTETSTGTDDGTSTGEPGDNCVVYVDAATGNDASSGLFWISAKQTLRAGLELASRYDCEVWVAAGTYYPSEIDDPAESFVLFPGAQVYGGFAGGESTLDERDWEANPTVLSGDLGVPGDIDDNSLHVVIGADGARLDGLEITGGHARDPMAGIDGAGLWVTAGSMTVAHCSFYDNRTGDAPPPDFGTIGVTGGTGAGIGFLGGDDLVVEDCSFHDNLTGVGSEGMAIGGGGGPGAGLSFQGASLTVIDSTFYDNLTGESAFGGDVSSEGGPGAGLRFIGDDLLVQGCSFVGNVTGAGGPAGDAGGSGGSGAAISARGGTIHITDTVLLDNMGGPGGFAGIVGGGGGIGGALSIEATTGTIIEGCVFEGNATGEGGPSGNLDGGAGIGGAIHMRGDVGDVLVAHTLFVGNTAGEVVDGQGTGGAISMMPNIAGMPQGTTTLVDNVFVGNSAGIGGALAMRSSGVGELHVVGCSFGNNEATNGSAVFYQSISPEGMAAVTLTNSILWGDPFIFGGEITTNEGFIGDPIVPLTVSSSIVDGGCVDQLALVCGAGILDQDPLYADPALGDLHPLGSAGVDQGDDATLPADVLDLDGDGDVAEPWSRDFDGNARVSGAAVDLGAFESP